MGRHKYAVQTRISIFWRTIGTYPDKTSAINAALGMGKPPFDDYRIALVSEDGNTLSIVAIIHCGQVFTVVNQQE